MEDFSWPKNFPTNQEMLELLQKTAKASWKNDGEFTLDHIQKWLDNFRGEVFDKEIEQRLALWLLCNYTYYNNEEIKHLCYDVFKQFLHDLIKYLKTETDAQLEHIFDKVCFAAMGNASESGGLLLYYFRQESKLGLNKFYYPTAFPQDDENIIVFIDDATLSGKTARAFFENNMNSIKHKKAYYLTLFASEEAINEIQQFDTTVISSTVLGNRERCFSEFSIAFSLFPGLIKPTEAMIKAYGIKIYPKHPLGYNNGQYCFGMYYNTPNNTLPIFWSNKNWYPVFSRKEKSNNAWRPDRFEEYI